MLKGASSVAWGASVSRFLSETGVQLTQLTVGRVSRTDESTLEERQAGGRGRGWSGERDADEQAMGMVADRRRMGEWFDGWEGEGGSLTEWDDGQHGNQKTGLCVDSCKGHWPIGGLARLAGLDETDGQGTGRPRAGRRAAAGGRYAVR